MKKLIVFALMFVTSAVFAVQNDVESVLGKFDFTSSEKSAIIAIFNDAKDKGLDQDELVDILKELQLKGASFYETVEYLAKKEKEIYEVKTSGFPYIDQKEVKYIAYYLIGSYSAKQFNSLTRLIKEKNLTAKDIENLFQFHLELSSYGVSLNDSYLMLYYIVKGGNYDRKNLDSINGLYLQSRDLRVDRNSITKNLTGGLSRGQAIKNIIYKIKNKQ